MSFLLDTCHKTEYSHTVFPENAQRPISVLLCNNLVPIFRRGLQFCGLLGEIHTKLNIKIRGEIGIQLTPSPSLFCKFLVYTSLDRINLIPFFWWESWFCELIGEIHTRINVRF